MIGELDRFLDHLSSASPEEDLRQVIRLNKPRIQAAFDQGKPYKVRIPGGSVLTLTKNPE